MIFSLIYILVLSGRENLDKVIKFLDAIWVEAFESVVITIF